MKTFGIRILDQRDHVISVNLRHILKEITNGKKLNWAILYIDVILKPNSDIPIVQLEKQINHSQNGYEINWKNLTQFAEKIHQEIDITIIGFKNKENMHRYKEDREMYETCDIVIEIIDGGFWEVFSKDKDLILKLKEKFKDIELLEPNFKK